MSKREVAYLNISVFTRHSEECPKKDNPQWRRCDCRKSIYIREGGKRSYVSAQTRSWEQAEKVAQQMREVRDPVNIELQKIAEQEAGKEAAAALKRTPLSDALAQWLKGKKEARESSLEAYQSTARRILRWAESNSIVNIGDVTPLMLDQLRSEWAPDAEGKGNRLALTTQAALLTRIKGFFAWATAIQMLDRNPALALKSIKVGDSKTMPLTPQQFDQLLAATEKIDSDTRYESARVGQHLKALFLVQRFTGLRIGDALQLRKTQLVGNRISLTMQKRGNEAECVVPDFLPVLLHSLPYKKQITPDCFFVSSKARIRTSTNKWDRKVRRINKYISLTDDHGEPMEFHSHMLRDTFAVEMLLAGFAMEEVSRLLGHKSIAVTERYYAKWVKSRLRKLEDRVVATWRSQGLTVFGQ